MSSKSIGEIMNEVSDTVGKKAKADVLRANNTTVLVKFLAELNNDTPWAWEDRKLPNINHTEDSPEGMQENTIAMELRRLYLFRAGAVDPKKQDELLCQFVESLSKIEMEIIVAMVQGKKLPVKGLTSKFIADLFDGKI